MLYLRHCFNRRQQEGFSRPLIAAIIVHKRTFSNCPALCTAYFSACLMKSCIYRMDESIVNLVPNQLNVTLLTKGLFRLVIFTI